LKSIPPKTRRIQMNSGKISSHFLKSGDTMLIPEIVEQMFNLSALGWGKKRIAKKLGTTAKTVSQSGYFPMSLDKRLQKNTD
jgi:hypothetical protein